MKNLSFITAALLCAVTVCKSQSIVSISPSSAAAGQTLNVTITGSGTHFLSGSATTLQFGFEQCSGTVVNSMVPNTNTMITANITVPGSYLYNTLHDVEVFDLADGYLVKDHSFEVTGANPFPVTLTPNSGAAGQTLNVTITGTGTHFTQGSSSTVKIGLDLDQRVCYHSTTYFSSTPSSDTQMIVPFIIPANADTGYFDVGVFGSGDNFGWLQNIFHITGPVSVNELEAAYHLEVAPNPFGNATLLNYALTNTEAIGVELYDPFGRKIFTENPGKQMPGLHAVRIDAGELNLSNGIYYLRFSAGNRNVTKKILVNR
jgi:hypothetical protein